PAGPTAGRRWRRGGRTPKDYECGRPVRLGGTASLEASPAPRGSDGDTCLTQSSTTGQKKVSHPHRTIPRRTRVHYQRGNTRGSGKESGGQFSRLLEAVGKKNLT